jgi:DNA invertase Pin-like site-specific DNA recombinase
VALVYSYIRYSSKKQITGDSMRRQIKLGDDWVRDNGHSFAERSFRDLGVSAFRGKNKHRGALSKFLQEIEDDRIPRGSILLIENLDRLSREGIDQAGDLFKKIIRAGVDIFAEWWDHEILGIPGQPESHVNASEPRRLRHPKQKGEILRP